MSEGDRVFRIVTRFLVGLLVVGLIATGVLVWAARMGYWPSPPSAQEPEPTPLERFASEFWKGQTTIKARFVGGGLHSPSSCPSWKPCVKLLWKVAASDDYPWVFYRTYTDDLNFITVLEPFATDSWENKKHLDLEFEITILQENYRFDAGIAYVESTLLRIMKQSEDGYLIWQPFAFQPSLELIEKFFAEETFDPEDAERAKAQLEHWKQAYAKMVEYAQEGDIRMAHHVRAHLTQVVLDHVLERPHTVHASTIPLCAMGNTCDFRFVERNTDDDDSLKLYLVEDWKDAERAVRSLPKEIKDLIEGVEIIALEAGEELGVNWIHYDLAIEINGVWYTINPLPWGTKVHHW